MGSRTRWRFTAHLSQEVRPADIERFGSGWRSCSWQNVSDIRWVTPTQTFTRTRSAPTSPQLRFGPILVLKLRNCPAGHSVGPSLVLHHSKTSQARGRACQKGQSPTRARRVRALVRLDSPGASEVSVSPRPLLRHLLHELLAGFVINKAERPASCLRNLNTSKWQQLRSDSRV